MASCLQSLKLFYLAGWPLCGQTFRKRKPLIFKAFSGVCATGKQCKCEHTCHFHRAGGPAKMLVGDPPQTRRFGTKCPKALTAELPLSGLFLIFPSLGDVTQMIDIALDGDKLPHGFLRGAVLRGQGLFFALSVPAAPVLASPFWAASPRPKFHSWWSAPRGRPPVPPHVRPDIF